MSLFQNHLKLEEVSLMIFNLVLLLKILWMLLAMISGMQHIICFRFSTPNLIPKFRIVIDCSGNTRAIESGINRVAHGGIFLQFGVAPSTATCAIRPFHIYEREITIQGVMVNPWAFPEAIALVGLLKDRYLDFSKLGESNKSQIKAIFRVILNDLCSTDYEITIFRNQKVQTR